MPGRNYGWTKVAGNVTTTITAFDGFSSNDVLANQMWEEKILFAKITT